MLIRVQYLCRIQYLIFLGDHLCHDIDPAVFRCIRNIHLCPFRIICGETVSHPDHHLIIIHVFRDCHRKHIAPGFSAVKGNRLDTDIVIERIASPYIEASVSLAVIDIGKGLECIVDSRLIYALSLIQHTICIEHGLLYNNPFGIFRILEIIGYIFRIRVAVSTDNSRSCLVAVRIFRGTGRTGCRCRRRCRDQRIIRLGIRRVLSVVAVRSLILIRTGRTSVSIPGFSRTVTVSTLAYGSLNDRISISFITRQIVDRLSTSLTGRALYTTCGGISKHRNIIGLIALVEKTVLKQIFSIL